MAATVLNSPQTVSMSVFVVQALVRLREQVAANRTILKRLAELDKTFDRARYRLGGSLRETAAAAATASRLTQATHWLPVEEEA